MSVPSVQPCSLEAIKSRINADARRVGLDDVRVFGSPQGDGSPYIEVGDEYHFVFEERGIESERKRTNNLDDLLYWFWDGVTFSRAVAEELRSRRPNEDPRRQLFAIQERLLGELRPAWRDRKADIHRRILAMHPFADGRG